MRAYKCAGTNLLWSIPGNWTQPSVTGIKKRKPHGFNKGGTAEAKNDLVPGQ